MCSFRFNLFEQNAFFSGRSFLWIKSASDCVFPEFLKKIPRCCMLWPPFCGVLLVQRITGAVMVALVCFEIVGFLITETKALLLFLSFFQVCFFFNMVPWVLKRHFNLACTISFGCINNSSEPTAFLRNLKQEPIADHFKLIHPAVGRKNCDSRAFLSTISFFHRCWRKRNYILIHFFSLAWIRKQKDISLRLAQFPFDS